MPSLILVPATEAMAQELNEIYFEAFKDNPAHCVMYPDTGPAVRERACERNRRNMRGPKDPDEYDFAIVDTSLPSTNPAAPQGVIVGHGCWKLKKEDVTRSEAAEHLTIEGSNAAAMHAFFSLLDGKKERYMGGRRLWHLQYISVWPKYQGRGVARFLIEWGIRKADEMNLEAYLDGTPEGKWLYTKLGFEVLEEYSFDLEPFGGKGIYYNYSMLRQPKKLGS